MSVSGPRTSILATGWVLAIVVAALPAHALTPGPGPAVRPAALTPSIPHDAVALGALAAGEPFAFAVVLAPTHTDELQPLLDAQRDPRSPEFGRYLAPGEFAQRFGPSPATVAAVTGWLRGRGLADVALERGGFTLAVHTTAGAAAHALGVSIERYRTATGDIFSATAAPLVPAALVGGLAAIVGLTDAPAARPHLDPSPRALPRGATRAAPHADGLTPCAGAANLAGLNGYWTPDQVGQHYGVGGLVSAGQSGAGREVALVELAPHTGADTAAFLACFGLHNRVDTRIVDGGGTAAGNGTLEANIDIEEAAAQAPGAGIVSYEGPNSDIGELDVYDAIVSGDRAQSVSTSWGFCEPLAGGAFMSVLHTLLAQAALQGQTVVAASGDSGSEDCLPADGSTALAVDSPANDPTVTGVGGTTLFPHDEPVWNDCEGASPNSCGGDAGGGGLAQFFARPAWQPRRPGGSCLSAAGTCRQVPDVAANSGIGEVFRSGGVWTAVGGTSIAAPKIAGIVADVDSRCIASVGDLAPKVVVLAGSSAAATARTDVTEGDNDLTRTNGDLYPATTGLDMATGVGTPVATGWSCPNLTAISRSAAPAGAHLTIAGIGLAGASIRFGNVPATVLAHHATNVTVVAPAGSGTVTISGTNAIGTGSQTLPFTYTSSGKPTPAARARAYRTVAADGGVFSFGGAPFYGSTGNLQLAQPIVGAASDAATGGYWFVARDGGVFAFHAPFLGSLAAAGSVGPVVAMASTPDGRGYWLVTSAGTVAAFGNAPGLGSFPSAGAPVVGIASAPDGRGYWIAAADGRVVAFGTAHDYGSMAGVALTRPIVAITADGATGGYWIVAADGGIFAFHAPFFGSTGALRLNQPIVGIAAAASGAGYWMVARDGGVFSFGATDFSGSMGGATLNQPMVGIAAAS